MTNVVSDFGGGGSNLFFHCRLGRYLVELENTAAICDGLIPRFPWLANVDLQNNKDEDENDNPIMHIYNVLPCHQIHE